MINRKQTPPVLDAVNFAYNLQPLQQERLGNNIPLYWLNAGTQDVVQVDWVFNAGLWQEQQTAVAQAVAALLKNGTAVRTALEINEAIEFYGASLKVSANNDYTIVTLHTLTRHLAALLPVIKEILTEASFHQQELQTYIQNARQRLGVSLRQCDFVANRHIDAYLFGRQHPYGRFTEDADLQALNTAALRDFHRKYYQSGNCRIFMAGKLDKTQVEMVAAHFGREQWGDTRVPEARQHATTPAQERKYRINNDENGVQGAVRIARSFPTRKHPDFAPMQILNTLFGGYFGSRLMANIREEKGFTYGIYSQVYNYRYDGALLIATEAGRDVCEQTVTEIYKEMDLLCQEKVSEEELLLVKNYLLGNILGDLDGPFSIMQRWKNIILNDLPQDQFDQNIELYKAIGPEKLRDLAQHYLNKEDYYELVVI
jgi:predicted Zn-dependent peptidase